MRTPAFVDRMDVADDADGRVAIFTGDDSPPAAEPVAPPPPHRGAFGGVAARVGVWLDGAYAGVAIAVALVVILVLGLLLSRH